MQARQFPAVRGWNWIVEGFRLFRSNPALLSFLVFGYWLTLIFLNLVPVVGAVIASLCVPALSVGVMNGCRELERAGANGFGLLYSGFRKNRNALLVLGAAYLAGSLLVLAGGALFDGGALMQVMTSGEPPPEDLMESGELLLGLRATLLLMVPLLMAFWFAPLLVAWNDVPVVKALFFSFVACLRNWRPFLVYGLGIAFVSAVLPGIVLGIAGSLSPSLLRMLAVAISLPLLFVFVPTLFASFYVSYRDVFVSAAAPADG
ncbi:MAG TPA: BPSS1780 family membrane protein [Candidatus Desulfobacillus sp.]|nr:BPSS1780 family membrane protein [Candidatus Desulfobacillus sp.]